MTAEQLTIVTKMVGTGLVLKMETFDYTTGTVMTIRLENGHVDIYPNGSAEHYDFEGDRISIIAYGRMNDKWYDFKLALRRTWEDTYVT
jgi:hypothetical protein